MIEKIRNDYKYQPHIPLGFGVLATLVTAVALTTLIGVYGTFQNALAHQHTVMFTLMTLGAAEFVIMAFLITKRATMVHDFKQEVDHFFQQVEPLKEPRFPRGVLKIIVDYSEMREKIVFLVNLGVPVQELKPIFLELCEWHQNNNKVYMPFYKGISGVLSYQNVPIRDAWRLLLCRWIQSLSNDAFCVLSVLMFNKRHGNRSFGEGYDKWDSKEMTAFRSPYISVRNDGNDDLFLIDQIFQTNELSIIHLYFWMKGFDYMTVNEIEHSGKQGVALYYLSKHEDLLEASHISSMFQLFEHACLLGWDRFVAAFIKKYNEKHEKRQMQQDARFSANCWGAVLLGAHCQKDPFKLTHNVVSGEFKVNEKSLLARRCEQIKEGHHMNIVTMLLNEFTMPRYTGIGLATPLEYAEREGLTEIAQLIKNKLNQRK